MSVTDKNSAKKILDYITLLVHRYYLMQLNGSLVALEIQHSTLKSQKRIYL